VPEKVANTRDAVFLVAGIAVNELITRLFEGDVYWSLSLGIISAIGTSVYNLGRPRRITKEKAQFEERLQVYTNCVGNYSRRHVHR
jgi:hypothetical protein